MTSVQIDINSKDGLSSATAIKGPTKAATVGNITLYGEQTIDGVSIVTDDRVLVKDQTTASENGIYVADTGNWRRSKDFNKTKDVKKGSLVLVTDGATNAGLWTVTTSDPITVGTTSISFALTFIAVAPAWRDFLDVPPYVASVAALQALDTSKDTTAIVKAAGHQFLYHWTTGDLSAQITAADPRYIASSANPTGSAGAWVQAGSTETGQFFQTLGANVHYLADRVMIGSAVANKASPVASQPDWLTTFLLARGRSTGFLEFAQMGVLNNSNSNSANAIVAGAQTSNLAGVGNSIPAIFVGVNNNSSFATNTYGWYSEAYRMSGAIGGAYGCEIDTMNYQALAATNPFAQASGQTVGIQLAAGGGLSAVGQFAASVGLNFWNNNAVFDKGISFGFTAINGTNGTDGNTGEAIAMATGHAITYYYGNNTKSWTLKANIGVNGNYVISTAGTGALVVSQNTTAPQAAPSGTVEHLLAANGTSTRLLIDNYGAAPQVTMRAARNTAASPSASQAGDQIINIGGIAYGATGYSGSERVKILGIASENWTDSAQGTQIALQVTPVGSTTLGTAVTIGNDSTITGTGGIKSSHATKGVGYGTGAGGTVTQATSKSTGVTLNNVCGQITMNNAALAASTTVSFVLTNSAIAATDIIVLNHISGGTAGSYTLNARAAAGSATIDVRNVSLGSLSEAIVISYAVVKAVTA